MSGAPTGVVDIHCHVLPGVDDGSPDVATSLDFLRRAAASGTKAIVATPHQHPGRYPNAPPELRQALELLLEAREEAVRAGEGLPDVHLGAEVHLDEDLPRRVAEGERLTLAGGPYLLLELPDVFAMEPVEELLYQLGLAGFVPIVAHPERCGNVLREPARLRRFVELGALAQVTGSSIAGDFGEPCRRITESFLRAGLVHFVASDAHDLVRRTPCLAAARAATERAVGEEAARALFEDNPRAVLEGRHFDPPCPVAPEDEAGLGVGAWLRSLFGRR